MAAKISIIIPIYNMARYLHNCLDSIVSQTYEDIEIICVDDGSTDESADIVEQYRASDARIVLLKKENGGLSDSRNAGIKAAKGKYIMFVDSDDYVESDMAEWLYKAIRDSKSQIAISSYYRQSIDGVTSIVGELPVEDGHVMSGIEYLEMSENTTVVCCKIYEKDFIKKFEFPHFWYEDTAWTPIVMSYATKVCYVDKPFYHYIRREGSIVSSESDLRSLGSINAMDYTIENSNPAAKSEIAHYVARQLQYMMIRRKSYADCYANKIHELEGYFKESEAVMRDEQLQKKITPFFGEYESIPKRIYFDVFGKSDFSENISWKEKLLGTQGEIICLNEKNCDIEEDKTVKKAYEDGNYELVGHYFKLKKLYEYGGIALTESIEGVKYIAPLLTRSQAFFGFHRGNHILPDIYASKGKTNTIKNLIDACKTAMVEKDEFQNVLDNYFLSNNSVIHSFALEASFKKKFIFLKDEDVRIYASSVLSYDFGMKYAFTKLLTSVKEFDNDDYIIDRFYYDTIMPLYEKQIEYRINEAIKDVKKDAEREVKSLERRLKKAEDKWNDIRKVEFIWSQYRLYCKMFRKKNKK